MAVASRATIDDLRAIPGPAELIDGEIVRPSPASNDHGAILHAWVRPRRLGRVYPGDTGFILDEHTVFCPDVGFVSKARLVGVAGDGFQPGHYRIGDRIASPPGLDGFASDVAEFFAD
jgi:Uma2 family endonuclease